MCAEWYKSGLLLYFLLAFTFTTRRNSYCFLFTWRGRFVASPELIRELAANGQIATQYVDLDGNPTEKYPYNPSGSLYAIEGVTSPDGRIFGKMSYSERAGAHVAKNIPGAKEQLIFQSGINYFK